MTDLIIFIIFMLLVIIVILVLFQYFKLEKKYKDSQLEMTTLVSSVGGCTDILMDTSEGQDTAILRAINKIVFSLNDRNSALKDIETAVYDISDLEGKDRPLLNLKDTITDIVQFRKKSVELDGIKPEYNELVEYKKNKIIETEKINDFIIENLRKKGFKLYDWVLVLLKELYEKYNKLAIENTDLVKKNNNYKGLSTNQSDIIKEITLELRKNPKIDRLLRTWKSLKELIIDIINEAGKFKEDFDKYVDQCNFNTKKTDRIISDLQKENKIFKNRVHVKNQTIYAIRKEHGIPAPKRKKNKKLDKGIKKDKII